MVGIVYPTVCDNSMLDFMKISADISYLFSQSYG